MKKVHYGWTMCILGTLIIFVTMGSVSNAFSVFLPYIIEEKGFTYSQTSFLVTVRCLIAFVAMLTIKYYYKVFSVRLGIAIAVACAGIAYCMYGFSDNYQMFCIGAAVSGISYGLGSMVPITILMSRWFEKRRAFAIGICATGSGIATIFLAPLTTLLVENISMRTTFFVEGITILAIALAVFVMVRDEPKEKGLKPYGFTKNENNEIKETIYQEKTITASDWVFIGGVSLAMGALANPAFSHLTVLMTTEGIPSMTAAIVISTIGLILTFGKLIFGNMADRIGGYKTSVIFMSILISGHIVCCMLFTGNKLLCIPMAILLGAGHPIATMGISVWSGDLASESEFPQMVRRLQVIYAFGALVFASIPGIVADIYASYIPSYILLTGLNIIALLLLIVAYKNKRKYRKLK